MSCRAPVPSLDALIEPWPAGQVIHVIHDAAFDPESFNPGIDATGAPRNPTRFAPILDAKGGVVPYHRQHPEVDGLFWMSRQRDRDQALVLFGDRIGPALAGTRMGAPLRANDVLRQPILALVLRVGIDAG